MTFSVLDGWDVFSTTDPKQATQAVHEAPSSTVPSEGSWLGSLWKLGRMARSTSSPTNECLKKKAFISVH